MTEEGFDLGKTSQEIEKSGGTPPVDQWDPSFCGDIDMRIARDGKWFYMGTPIGRQKMVNLFSKVLWLEEGKYYLKTPVEKVGIQVDDAPFLFTGFEKRIGDHGDELVFTSSTEDTVVLGEEHRLWVDTCSDTAEPSPYIEVRFGMKGLIHRNVFYQLVEMAQEKEVDGRSMLVIESQGHSFELGAVD